MDRAATLEQLARLCRTGSEGMRAPDVEASGSASLDAVLPGGGWQVGSMVEMMPDAVGIGELQLLMPALSRISQSERYVALISPPFIPFPAALSQHGLRLEHLLLIRADKPTDALWACEQALRCRSFGAVIAWPATIKDKEVRRLQLAAEAGRSIGFLYRSTSAALEASPAATRLRMKSNQDGSLRVEILKCRGGRSGIAVTCLEKSPVVEKSPVAQLAPAVTHPAALAACI